jgi:hypothetical protein
LARERVGERQRGAGKQHRGAGKQHAGLLLNGREAKYIWRRIKKNPNFGHREAVVGEVPTMRSSDHDPMIRHCRIIGRFDS